MTVAISITAIVVSVMTFVLNYRHTQQADVIARMPVLVFEYTHDGWVLRNVGLGPAMNVVVARAPGGAQRPCSQEAAAGWVRPVRIPPLPRDGAFPIHWMARISKASLGATYVDFEGRQYTVTCRNDLSQNCPGRQLPMWSEDEIDRHWRLPPADE